jgi:hypothetical protein
MSLSMDHTLKSDSDDVLLQCLECFLMARTHHNFGASSSVAAVNDGFVDGTP